MQVEATNTGELNQYEYTGLTQCLKKIPLQFKFFGFNKITIIKTKNNAKKNEP